ELAQSGRYPRGIVHLWTLDDAAGATPDEVLARAQERGFYAVLTLVQALVRQRRPDAVDLTVAGDGLRVVNAGDEVGPAEAPLLGLSLVIPQEQPNIRCTTIDIGRPFGADAIAALRAEIAAGASGDAVANRGGVRLVQTFERRRLDCGRVLFRDRGVYLITGGLGQIGLELAEHLARSARARLVLVGRTTPPAREEWGRWLDTHPSDSAVSKQIRALEKIEAAGGEVLILSGDVADTARVREVVD